MHACMRLRTHLCMHAGFCAQAHACMHVCCASSNKQQATNNNQQQPTSNKQQATRSGLEQVRVRSGSGLGPVWVRSGSGLEGRRHWPKASEFSCDPRNKSIPTIQRRAWKLDSTGSAVQKKTRIIES